MENTWEANWMFRPKLDNEQRKALADEYAAGQTTQAELAKKYGVGVKTVCKICKDQGAAKKEKPKKATTRADMVEFTSRAGKVLWRQDVGRDEDRKTYHAWKARIEALESENGGGYSHHQAVVRASKEFPCLHRLFREYDLAEWDPNPESHPEIARFGQPAKFKVECENKEQSYRENLRWAQEAAGEYKRTGLEPTTCPNNSAFFLYSQAKEDPNNFLAKVGQVESKGDAESDERSRHRADGARTIEEIDGYLAELDVTGGDYDEA